MGLGDADQPRMGTEESMMLMMPNRGCATTLALL